MKKTTSKPSAAHAAKKPAKPLGEELWKVVLVGECGVGKSSLSTRAVDGTFTSEQSPNQSLGMDFKQKSVVASERGDTLKLQIWVG